MASKTKVSSAEETIKDIRRETRRKWIAEEKIRIVSEVGEIGGQRNAIPLG